MASATKPWYMTSARRKQMDAEFQTMLHRNHAELMASCAKRYPETIEGVLAEFPDCRDPQAMLASNIRHNERSARIEALMQPIIGRKSL